MAQIDPEIIQTVRDLCTGYKLGYVGLPNQEFLHDVIKFEEPVVLPNRGELILTTYLRKVLRPLKFSPEALQALMDAVPTYPEKSLVAKCFATAFDRYRTECARKGKKIPFRIKSEELVEVANPVFDRCLEERRAKGHEHSEHTFPELPPAKLYELADRLLDVMELKRITREQLREVHPDFTPQPVTPEREEHIRFCLRQTQFEEQVIIHFAWSTACRDEFEKVISIAKDENAKYLRNWDKENRDRIFREGGLEALERYDAAMERANSLSISEVDVDDPEFLRQVQSYCTAYKMVLVHKDFMLCFMDGLKAGIAHHEKDDEVTPAFIKLVNLFDRTLPPRDFDQALLDRILDSLATDVDRFIACEAFNATMTRYIEDMAQTGKGRYDRAASERVLHLNDRYQHILEGVPRDKNPVITFPELGIQYFALG